MDQMDSADHLDNGQVDEGADEGKREKERGRKKAKKVKVSQTKEKEVIVHTAAAAVHFLCMLAET